MKKKKNNKLRKNWENNCEYEIYLYEFSQHTLTFGTLIKEFLDDVPTGYLDTSSRDI